MSAKTTRQSFGEAIVKVGEKNPQVIVIDADLGKSTMTGEFAKKFPERHFEMGIAEQNMIGTAAGMSFGGKIPFATSFACFLAGRYETIRMSVAFSNANVKLIGTHAGIGIGEDGYSQMGLEDIALLRSLPNMVILQPADDVETQQAVAWAAEHEGPVYIRLTRQKVESIHGENYKFQFGKADILIKSKVPASTSAGGQSPKSKIAILATGAVVYESLKAAEELEKEGISVTVVNIHTIKPLDDEMILNLAREHSKIVVIEDHSFVGGLGSAVSEVVAGASLPVKVLRHGVHGFGESGHQAELYDKFGFSIPKIKKLVLKLLDS